MARSQAMRPGGGIGTRLAMALPAMKIQVNGLALLTFACGLAKPVTFEVFGTVYLAEIFLPVVALVALLSGSASVLWRQRIFWVVVAGLFTMLAGYMASDLIAQTPESRYLKGWGRTLFVITDFVALAIITARDRRNFWWWILGVGLGGLLYFRLVVNAPMMSMTSWKFDYGPAAMLALSAAAYFLPARIAALSFAALGIWNMHMDARSYSAVCIAIAALFWLRGDEKTGTRRNAGELLKVAIGLMLAGALVLFLLKSTENEWVQNRRAQSSGGRFIMLEAGVRVIAGSPLIGVGSWSRSRDIVDAVKESVRDSDDHAAMESGATFDAVSIHSQLLGSWVEAGLGAGLFFLTYGVLMIFALKSIVLERRWDALSPPLLFVSFVGLWDLMMSPYSATHRLDIAMALVASMIVGMERKLPPQNLGTMTAKTSGNSGRTPLADRYAARRSGINR